MSLVEAITRIPVGVVVERSEGVGPWTDFVWRPVSVIVGVAQSEPWTLLNDDGARAQFFAGTADVELYRSEAGNYRDNIAGDEPSLWVTLRRCEGEPPLTLFAVTADPAEGESFTEAGTDLVERVPMPSAVAEVIAAFVAEHYVDHAFVKRKRDRADPHALERRPPGASKERR